MRRESDEETERQCIEIVIQRKRERERERERNV